MITTKDLLYLSDMFEWNLNAYKLIVSYKENMNDQNLKKNIDLVLNTIYDNLDEILIILSGGDYER